MLSIIEKITFGTLNAIMLVGAVLCLLAFGATVYNAMTQPAQPPVYVEEKK